MRLIQWHLKINWRALESLEKVIPMPRSLHPNVRWWLQEDNVLQGQPLHTIVMFCNLYGCIKRRLGHSLRGVHCKRNLVPSRKQLTLKLSGTEGNLFGLKEFQDLYVDQIVLIATDNTTVVGYINKDGGMKSGPLCVLLWRILTWCSRKQVILKARQMPD